MSQLIERRELEKRAGKYGYHGLFATPDTLQIGIDYLDRARNVGDTTGTIIGMAMIQNYHAIQKAKANNLSDES